MYRFPGLRGGNRLAGGSLRMVAATFVCIQAEREGGDLVLVCFNIFVPCTSLPGWNRLPGGSLLAVAAILVSIEAEPKGGDLVLAYSNIFLP